jgi:hypothetical protein
VIAVVTAVAVVVVAVLPAEKGIDLTGLGRVIGLTQMGELKMELAEELAADEVVHALARFADSADAAESTAMVRDSARFGGAPPPPPSGARSDITTIAVPASAGTEVVLQMRRGGRVRYSWSTTGPVLDHVVFGDSSRVERGSMHVYRRGFGATAKVGVIIASFNGLHGWYWRNTTDSVVIVTLHTSGDYENIREVR